MAWMMKKKVACKGCRCCLQASSWAGLKSKMSRRNWRIDPKINRLKWKMSPVQIVPFREEKWVVLVRTGAQRQGRTSAGDAVRPKWIPGCSWHCWWCWSDRGDISPGLLGTSLWSPRPWQEHPLQLSRLCAWAWPKVPEKLIIFGNAMAGYWQFHWNYCLGLLDRPLSILESIWVYWVVERAGLHDCLCYCSLTMLPVVHLLRNLFSTICLGQISL